MISGSAELKSDKNNEAREIFTTALTVEPSNRNFKRFLLYNRGIANFQLKLYKDALDDYSEALRIKEDHAKGLFRRAQTHFQLKEFEECVIDCEESLRLKPGDAEAKKLLSVGKSSLSTVIIDPYKVLGIKPSATSGEIKKAFNKMSLLMHPDKHPRSTAVEKKKLSRKFQQVKEAYDRLMKNFGL